jgi:hypothetical protein
MKTHFQLGSRLAMAVLLGALAVGQAQAGCWDGHLDPGAQIWEDGPFVILLSNYIHEGPQPPEVTADGFADYMPSAGIFCHTWDADGNCMNYEGSGVRFCREGNGRPEVYLTYNVSGTTRDQAEARLRSEAPCCVRLTPTSDDPVGGGGFPVIPQPPLPGRGGSGGPVSPLP